MATDPRPRLLQAAKRAQEKRNRTTSLADSARAEYRRAIVAARDGGIGQTQLARELNTSASRIREDEMRGRLESSSTR